VIPLSRFDGQPEERRRDDGAPSQAAEFAVHTLWDALDGRGVADGATVVTDGRAAGPLEAVLSPKEFEHPASVRPKRPTRAP